MRRAAMLLLLAAASARGGWRVIPVGPTADVQIDQAVVVLPDGCVFLAGGSGMYGAVPTRATQIFDPRTRIFTPGPPLVTPRYDPAAVAVGADRILVAGGTTLSYVVCTDTAEVVDLTAWRSQATGSMSVRRGQAAVLVRAGEHEAVILGGVTEGRFAEATDLVERWSDATGRWTVDGRMQLPCMGALVVQDGADVIRMLGVHRCCGDPLNVACTAWMEIWDVPARRSVLQRYPLTGTYPAGVLQGPVAPGEFWVVGVRSWMHVRRVVAVAPGTTASWAVEVIPTGVDLPGAESSQAVVVLGPDDILMVSLTGLIVAHPSSGRPWECLASVPFRPGRAVALRPGIALVLPADEGEHRAVLVADDDALARLAAEAAAAPPHASSPHEPVAGARP